MQPTIVAFDVETTGLKALAGKIIEIAAIRFVPGQPRIAEFDQLVDPEMPIPPDAARVNGITQAMVEGQPRIRDVLPRFLDFLEGADLLAAHNAPFDAGFVAVEARLLGLLLPPTPILDTVSLARRMLPHLRNHRLGTVAGALGLGAGGGFHRAAADCRVVRGLFDAALLRLPQTASPQTWLQLFDHCTFDTGGVRFDVALPRSLRLLEKPLAQRRRIAIRYLGGSHGPSPRPITPLLVGADRDGAYLRAVCHLEGIEKTFRLELIAAVEQGG